MDNPELRVSRRGEARYEEGRFVFPDEEEEEEETEDREERKKFEEPSADRKRWAKIQARIVTGLLMLLQLIFKILNFLLTVLSKII